MTKDGKIHVVVAIPTMKRRVTDTIMDFMLGLWELNARADCPWHFSQIRTNNKTYIEAARNILVEMFLAMPTADRLFFIDSDTYPSKESIQLLQVKDAPIISGLYPILKASATQGSPPITTSVYRRARKPRTDGIIHFTPLQFEELDGKPHEVDALATGNMIVERRVFEDPRMIAGKDEDGTRAFFRWPRTPSGQTIHSDDMDFCIRAQEAGYRIVAHTGVIWGHEKPMDTKWVMEQLCIAYLSGQENPEEANEEKHVVLA